MRFRTIAIIYLLYFSLFAACLKASDVYSAGGVVHDASGAVIPGAEVTLRQSGSGIVLSTQTDKQGAFRIAGSGGRSVSTFRLGKWICRFYQAEVVRLGCRAFC